MRITVLTLFPEMYRDFVSTSIIGRAIERGLVTVDFVQIRDFAHDHYRHVDDKPFGGGLGQVMKCQPVLDALNSVKTENSYSMMMSPAGNVYNQSKARQLSQKDHLILLCGHYEGFDARINKHVDELVSIGDYVLTGGEMASMVIMDSVIRLLNGVIREGSADYQGDKVPDILLSGHHAKIQEWRTQQSLLLTKTVRPDLFEKHQFTEYEEKVWKKLCEQESE